MGLNPSQVLVKLNEARPWAFTQPRLTRIPTKHSDTNAGWELFEAGPLLLRPFQGLWICSCTDEWVSNASQGKARQGRAKGLKQRCLPGSPYAGAVEKSVSKILNKKTPAAVAESFGHRGVPRAFLLMWRGRKYRFLSALRTYNGGSGSFQKVDCPSTATNIYMGKQTYSLNNMFVWC